MISGNKENALPALKALLENIPDGCVIVDQNRVINNFNPAALELFGYDPVEITGKQVEFLLSEDTSAENLNDLITFCNRPEKKTIGKNGTDLFARKKNGGLFPIEISLSPIETESDFFVLTIIRDLTENYDLKKQITGSNELWNTLSGGTDDIISVLNNKGAVVSINKVPENFSSKNLSMENVLGKPGSNFFQLDTAVAFRKKFNSVLSEKKTGRLEVSDENSEWYEIALIPVLQNEQVENIIFTIKRITDRKMAEENRVFAKRTKIMSIIETRQNERLRISYDLREGLEHVLASLNMYIILLEDYLPEEDRETKAVFSTVKELSQRAINECRAISHNLLPKNLMESGVVSAVTEMISTISGIQNSVLILLTADDEFSGKRYSKEKEMVMYRVLQELIHNTVNYASASYLTIAISVNKGRITIKTEDDGKGIDPLILSKGGETGLLEMKRRIRDVNGQMDVLTSPGAGTRYCIIIPEN